MARTRLPRDYWQRRIQTLDPERDAREIYFIHSAHEFPWDMHQALSFALYRTYAIPSIGALLFRTGEFTERTQKRYDDTALLLDAVLEHGIDNGDGREAVRRVNRMHNSYDISNDDMLYVLATFVVVPVRWVDDHGWRQTMLVEREATANYYRELGRHMNIREIPTTYEGFAEFLDSYEDSHFGVDPGGIAVSEATLGLFATFPPFSWLPSKLVKQSALALMDDALLDAFAYPHPSAVERRAIAFGLQARNAIIRKLPPRMEPKLPRDAATIRSYPGGHLISELGTFPTAEKLAAAHRPGATS